MARIEGKFVWFEVMSDDPEKAQRFYTDLFGWGVQEMDMDAGPYTAFTVGDRPVGGFLPAQEGQTGWLSYLSVGDVDKAVTATEKRGGQVLKPAFDVPGVGRVAVVSEPSGAVFALFTGTGDDPADGPQGAGDIHWNELWTADPSRAAAFFQDAYGFEGETMPMPAGDYVVLNKKAVGRAGVAHIPPAHGPSHFLQYVRVDDCDATLQRAQQLGGKAVGDVQKVPGVGRFSVVEDPTGTRIGVITPDAV